MNKSDKTKSAISQSLIEILQKKPLDLITVKELTTTAHVGRTAFYNNFKSLEDVLKYIYRDAHRKIFGNKSKDLSYQYSDNFINDMIEFYDKNSELLNALYKWNLIGIIAKYNTNLVINYTENYDDEIIKNNPFYYVCFSNTSVFNTCLLWIINGKKESKEELFKLIKYFQNLPLQYIDYHS